MLKSRFAVYTSIATDKANYTLMASTHSGAILSLVNGKTFDSWALPIGLKQDPVRNF